MQAPELRMPAAAAPPTNRRNEQADAWLPAQ